MTLPPLVALCITVDTGRLAHRIERIFKTSQETEKYRDKSRLCPFKTRTFYLGLFLAGKTTGFGAFLHVALIHQGLAAALADKMFAMPL